MRVLVAFGSKLGGTEGLAEMVGSELGQLGLEVDVRSAREVDDVTSYDAVIVGGALYTLRWHRDARRFVSRHRKALRDRPVWFFSSGPLDDSAVSTDIPPVRTARKAMDRVGARGHVTFGGAMPADAKGFPASAMAKDNAGDWRDPDHVQRWAKLVAEELALKP